MTLTRRTNIDAFHATQTSLPSKDGDPAQRRPRIILKWCVGFMFASAAASILTPGAVLGVVIAFATGTGIVAATVLFRHAESPHLGSIGRFAFDAAGYLLIFETIRFLTHILVGAPR